MDSPPGCWFFEVVGGGHRPVKESFLSWLLFVGWSVFFFFFFFLGRFSGSCLISGTISIDHRQWSYVNARPAKMFRVENLSVSAVL